MINTELINAIHRMLMLNLAIRMINLDRRVINQLHMALIVDPLIDAPLKRIYAEYYPLKRWLKKQKIELVKWQIVDVHFSEVILRTPGDNLVLRYGKFVLKNEVEVILKNAMNIH